MTREYLFHITNPLKRSFDHVKNLSLLFGVTADVFDVPTWKSEIKDATAVVSCIGAFGSNEVSRPWMSTFQICVQYIISVLKMTKQLHSSVECETTIKTNHFHLMKEEIRRTDSYNVTTAYLSS